MRLLQLVEAVEAGVLLMKLSESVSWNRSEDFTESRIDAISKCER